MPTTIVLRSKRRERALAVQKLQHLLPAILLLHGIDWIDVFAASVIFVETLEHYHRTGHIVRPNVLMIATLLALFRPPLGLARDRLIAGEKSSI
jgi:hypothetical protein